MLIARRHFLGSLAGAVATTFVVPQLGRAAPKDPSPVFWVHVQGTGGWDQALFCDPKPSVRSGLPAAEREIRMAGNIPYLSFADLGAPAGEGFFASFHDRLLVINGVDTGTNNHTVGEAYSASGSTVPGYPCWAAQIGAVYGAGEPMPFISHGGYDGTGGLLAPARIPEGSEGVLRRLGSPTRDPNDQEFLSAALADRVRDAHRARLLRQQAAARLPDRARELSALLDARATEGALSRLEIPGYDPEATGAEQKFKLALSAFQAELTASVGLSVGGFDSHDSNETTQRGSLANLFRVLSRITELSEAAGVPMIVLASSDFGRTPHMTGSGTDHHPISSVLVMVNRAAQALDLGLPVNTVIGTTTDGNAARALKAVRVDPESFQPDDSGILLTPGHVMRVMRRIAGIGDSPTLGAFPLTVDADLALG